jgi:hypothetical protein
MLQLYIYMRHTLQKNLSILKLDVGASDPLSIGQYSLLGNYLG